MSEIPHFSDHDHDEPDSLVPHEQATPADWENLYADASQLVRKANSEQGDEPADYPYVGWINRNGDDVSLTLDPEGGDFRVYVWSSDHSRDLDVTFNQSNYVRERRGSAYGNMFTIDVDDEGIDRSVVEMVMSDAPGTYIHETWRGEEVERIWGAANHIAALSYKVDKARLGDPLDERPIVPLPGTITTSNVRQDQAAELGYPRVVERLMFRPQPEGMNGLLVPIYASYTEYRQDGAFITEPQSEFALLDDKTMSYAYAGREVVQTSDPHRLQEMADYVEVLLHKLQTGESEIE